MLGDELVIFSLRINKISERKDNEFFLFQWKWLFFVVCEEAMKLKILMNQLFFWQNSLGERELPRFMIFMGVTEVACVSYRFFLIDGSKKDELKGTSPIQCILMWYIYICCIHLLFIIQQFSTPWYVTSYSNYKCMIWYRWCTWILDIQMKMHLMSNCSFPLLITVLLSTSSCRPSVCVFCVAVLHRFHGSCSKWSGYDIWYILFNLWYTLYIYPVNNDI